MLLTFWQQNATTNWKKEKGIGRGKKEGTQKKVHSLIKIQFNLLKSSGVVVVVSALLVILAVVHTLQEPLKIIHK